VHVRCGSIIRRDYSSLIPANLITLAHFSVSSAIVLAKSAGEPDASLKPHVASCALICESARTVFISPLSLSTIAAGVPCGAQILQICSEDGATGSS
jgi:hypothetical protein